MVRDLRRHPLHTVRDAEQMLREAQATADAHWAAQSTPVPVQETYVLCDDAAAPWAATVAEAVQRYVADLRSSRIRVMPQGVTAVAECILEAQTCAELYVSGQGAHDPEDDATLLLSGTQARASPPSAPADEARHEEDLDVFPPTQPAGPAVYAGDISLYSPEQRPHDVTMDLTEEMPLSDSPSLEDITDPTLEGAAAEPQRGAPRAFQLPAAPRRGSSTGAADSPADSPRAAHRAASPDPIPLPEREAFQRAAPGVPSAETPWHADEVRTLPPATGPFQDHAESGHAPVSSTPPPTALQRLAGTRQARRSLLLDELFGLTQEPPRAVSVPTPTQSVHERPTPAVHTPPPATDGAAGADRSPSPIPPPRSATPPDSRARSATPPSASMDTSLQRTSFVQVRYAPLVRATPPSMPAVRNYKKFRANGRRAAPQRVALVLPHDPQGRPSPSRDVLFLDEPTD